MVNNEDKELKTIKRISIWGIVALVTTILFFLSFYTIATGERGILLTFGVASPQSVEPGPHFKAPFVQGIAKMNIQTITVSFDNHQGQGDNSEYSSLFAASKDLQDVQVALVMNYHINPNDVVAIYSQYGESYQTNVIEPIIRDTVKATSAKYTAEELVTKRADFNAEIGRVLSEKLAAKQAVLETVNVVNFQFSESFSKAIEEKVTAEQNALKARNQLEQVKYEAEQRITQAEAEAKAIQIQAQAIQSQGGAAYVQLQAINKWNGILPAVTGGATPFIDFRQISGQGFSSATPATTGAVANLTNSTH